MNLGNISYSISVSTEKLRQSIADATKTITGFNRETQDAAEGMSNAFGGVSLENVNDAINETSDAIKDSARMALASEEELRQANETRIDLIRQETEDLAELKQMRDASTSVSEIEEYNKRIAETQKRINALASVKPDGLKEMNTELKDVGGHAGSLGDLQTALGSVSPAAGQAVQGFQKMSVAAKAFQAALGPIGLIIMALGVAIGALTAYFKGSVDGQEKMAKIMGTLNGVMTVLKDAAIEVGRWIAWAFENPQEAVKQLWETIKQNIINRFQGMVEMVVAGWNVISKGAQGVGASIAGIFDKSKRDEAKLLFGEMTQGMKEFGVAAFKAASGIADIDEKISGTWDKIKEKAKEGSDIDVRANALKVKQAESLVTIARLEAQIAEARRISQDDSYNLTQQIEASAKAMELVDKKMAIQEGLAREALSIQKAKNALGESNNEDIAQAKRLEAELINLTTQREREIKRIVREHQTLLGQQDTEAKAIQQALKDEEDLRAGVLEEIRKAGRTEIEVLQEAMMEKIAAHEWSVQEQVKIEEHYMAQIDAIRAAQEEEQIAQAKDIMQRIQEYRMTDLQWAEAMRDKELAAYGLSIEEKAEVYAFWAGKITEIEEQEIQKRLEAERVANEEKVQMQLARLNAVAQGISLLGQISQAAMQHELKMAGDNESEKEKIQRKYAKKRKAISMGEAIIGTAKAVINALQMVPFPLGLVMAGLAAAMGAAQIATIAAAPMKTGGVIPPGFPNDTYPALLTSGETVIPPKKLESVTSQQGPMVARLVGAGPDLLIYLSENKRKYE